MLTDRGRARVIADDGFDPRTGLNARPEEPAACAADFGFTRNSSAAAVARPDPDGRVIRLLAWLEWRPRRGLPLVPSEVFAGTRDLAIAHGCHAVCADGHAKESAKEVLSPAGLAFVDAPGLPSVAVLEVRRLLQENRIAGLDCDGVIIGQHKPDEHVGLLLRQLEAVKIEHGSGGHVRVLMPVTRDGRHGDVASAVLLALWRASRIKPYTRPIGSPLVRA